MDLDAGKPDFVVFVRLNNVCLVSFQIVGRNIPRPWQWGLHAVGAGLRGRCTYQHIMCGGHA